MATVQSELAIEAHGVARRFGARWVLRGITLELRPGEIVGLLGSNGSGKTTLLRIFGTLLKPSAGTARIYGHDIVREPNDVREDLGFLAHTPGLYDDLTARENLRFAAEMLGQPVGANLDAALERVGLTHVTNERVRGFSAGMQRRLALARLLLRRPRLLLLDEPYSNLDSAGIALMNSIIVEAGHAGGGALVVLHELAPAAGVLDRTITIVNGRVAESAPAPAPRVRIVAGAG
ncbi:MAG TPA: heme ABC exporter ATP-binding protein CcmA [Gemmatimonadaceae bacterium]|nr:heme ABC exporter ATP-binding protein CcmA [Gemmatimonadaceae bacterium]